MTPSSGLATTSSTSTSMAAFAMASRSLLTLSLVRRAITVHVDWFIILGGLGGGLMPSGKIMVGAFASRVVLAIACAVGVGVLGVCHSIKLIGAAVEERDPTIVCISVICW